MTISPAGETPFNEHGDYHLIPPTSPDPLLPSSHLLNDSLSLSLQPPLSWGSPFSAMYQPSANYGGSRNAYDVLCHQSGPYQQQPSNSTSTFFSTRQQQPLGNGNYGCIVLINGHMVVIMDV